MAACEGGRLIVHFINREECATCLSHTNRDVTPKKPLALNHPFRAEKALETL